MDMVKVYRASNNIEADFIKSVLTDHGINAFIQGYHHRSMLGLLGPYVQLDIMIPEADLQKAEEILKQCENEISEKKGNTPEAKKEEQAPLGLRPRHTGVALMLAFIFPGFGSVYAGEKNLGQWIVIATAICYISILMFFDIFFKYVLFFVPCLMILDAFLAIRYIRRHRARHQQI